MNHFGQFGNKLGFYGKITGVEFLSIEFCCFALLLFQIMIDHSNEAMSEEFS